MPLTVGELRKFLDGVPDEVQIVLENDDYAADANSALWVKKTTTCSECLMITDRKDL